MTRYDTLTASYISPGKAPVPVEIVWAKTVADSVSHKETFKTRVWEWLNHVSVYDGWSPLQAIIFLITISPVIAAIVYTYYASH